MAGYLPTLPGVPAPALYGQGYGNWQQYAGFDTTKNPYGGSQGLGVQPEDRKNQGVAPPKTVADTNIPKAPEPVTPDYSLSGPMGAAPNEPLGASSSGALGTSIEDVIKLQFGG